MRWTVFHRQAVTHLLSQVGSDNRASFDRIVDLHEVSSMVDEGFRVISASIQRHRGQTAGDGRRL
jgi:hypothetical protein